MSTVPISLNLPKEIRESLKLALAALNLSIPTDNSVSYIQAVADRKRSEQRC